MADIFTPDKQQSTQEIRQWDIDFGADLEGGVAVNSASATHTPPTGTPTTPSVGAIQNNIVPVTLGPVLITGVHYLDVLAILSDGEKSACRLAIQVNF